MASPLTSLAGCAIHLLTAAWENFTIFQSLLLASMSCPTALTSRRLRAWPVSISRHLLKFSYWSRRPTNCLKYWTENKKEKSTRNTRGQLRNGRNIAVAHCKKQKKKQKERGRERKKGGRVCVSKERHVLHNSRHKVQARKDAFPACGHTAKMVVHVH